MPAGDLPGSLTIFRLLLSNHQLRPECQVSTRWLVQTVLLHRCQKLTPPMLPGSKISLQKSSTVWKSQDDAWWRFTQIQRGNPEDSECENSMSTEWILFDRECKVVRGSCWLLGSHASRIAPPAKKIPDTIKSLNQRTIVWSASRTCSFGKLYESKEDWIGRPRCLTLRYVRMRICSSRSRRY